jgi:hypothetical protein
MFIGIKAYNQSVALLLPLLQLSNKILFEFSVRTCQITPLDDRESVVLLVGRAAIQIFVVAGVVSAHHPGLNSIAFQGHH